MQGKLQLELLGSVKRTRPGSSGFTLVELMIVVGIVGVLSAVALPRYLQARNAAAAAVLIVREVRDAKNCATWVISGVGQNPDPSRCKSDEVSLYGGSWWPEFGPVKSGLRCLDKSNGGGTGVKIEVSSTGGLSCTFSGSTS